MHVSFFKLKLRSNVACKSRIKRCLAYLDVNHAEHSRIPVKQSQRNNGNSYESQDEREMNTNQNSEKLPVASREQPNYVEGKRMLKKLNAWLGCGFE